MKRKIAWEKWWDVDPEVSDFQNQEPQAFNKEEEEGEEEFEYPMFSMDSFFQPKKINTPLGPFEVGDPFSPGNMFDCWIAHTNFTIGKNELDILNNIPGIEALEIMSKYRFFIGVGKMFNFMVVRTNIQKELCHSIETPQIINTESKYLQEVNDIFSSVSGDSKWVIFMGNDGSIKHLSMKDFSTVEEYEKNVEELKSLKNGRVISCEDL